MVRDGLSAEDQEQVDWYRNILIPDLKDSGRIESARDIETLCDMVEKYANEETRLQVQDEASRALGEGAEEAAEAPAAGRSNLRTDEDGQDQDSN